MVSWCALLHRVYLPPHSHFNFSFILCWSTCCASGWARVLATSEASDRIYSAIRTKRSHPSNRAATALAPSLVSAGLERRSTWAAWIFARLPVVCAWLDQVQEAEQEVRTSLGDEVIFFSFLLYIPLHSHTTTTHHHHHSFDPTSQEEHLELLQSQLQVKTWRWQRQPGMFRKSWKLQRL